MLVIFIISHLSKLEDVDATVSASGYDGEDLVNDSEEVYCLEITKIIILNRSCHFIYNACR